MIRLVVSFKLQKQRIYVYLSNSIVNKEYREFFPFAELAKTYEVIPIFSKTIFAHDQKFVEVKLHSLTRKFHAILHYCLIWYRRYSSLAYKLRAFQYFGTKSEISETTTFWLYDGRKHKTATRFFVRVFGNRLGILFVTKLVMLCFEIELRRKDNKISFEKSLIILPYHGGISLEYDFLTWLSKKYDAQSIGIQQNWDNVSSKSFLFQHPTYFLTWGKQSTSHLRTIQSYRGTLKEIGSFRFNEFYNEKLKIESQIDRFEMSKNINDKLKILVIGTGPGTHDYKINEMIMKLIADNSIKDFEVTFRLHPYQVASGRVQTLKKVQGVQYDIPSSNEKNNHRLKLIMDSDVIVSLYSTVLLEATILNKPCIIPAFVPGAKGYNTSYMLDDVSHYSGLSSIQSMYVANSVQEFLDFLKDSKLVRGQVRNSEQFLNWFCKNTNTVQDVTDIINQIMTSHEDLR